MKRSNFFILALIVGVNGFVLFLILQFSLPLVLGGLGNQTNVTTNLTVGASYPTILNVSINNGSDSVTLTANDTTTVYCVSRIVDFNGEDNISNVEGVFYDNVASSRGDSDDNNSHYTNSSCNITTDFGSWNGYADDAYHILANCTFQVQYYANASTWNCSVNVTDDEGLTDQKDDDITINELLAMGIQDSIEFGTINATYVSDEQTVNVENFGNVFMDVQMRAWAATPGDNLSMNCSLGLDPEIELDYLRYNVTNDTSGGLSLAEFQNVYKSVTNDTTLEEINLTYRTNDTVSDAINPTYWRVYVPLEVAGTCSGTVEVSAIKST